jgi:hypothetical protein
MRIIQLTPKQYLQIMNWKVNVLGDLIEYTDLSFETSNGPVIHMICFYDDLEYNFYKLKFGI